jgi:hypothetical protein
MKPAKRCVHTPTDTSRCVLCVLWKQLDVSWNDLNYANYNALARLVHEHQALYKQGHARAAPARPPRAPPLSLPLALRKNARAV